MFLAGIALLLLALALVLVRAISGPTVYDRVMAANSVGTLAILILSIHGFLRERPEFLDLALIYAVLNIIGTIAVLKFFRYGDLGDPGEEPSDS